MVIGRLFGELGAGGMLTVLSGHDWAVVRAAWRSVIFTRLFPVC